MNKQVLDLQRIINSFRDRWTQEYLTGLREYHTATGNNRQTLSDGDVVQIQQEGSRLHWNLGVIEEMSVGNDGHIRSVKLSTKNGITNRPIRKLFPLEINEN